MTTDDLDRMLSGGAKSAFNRDSRVGDSITGIVRNIAVRQATEYGTGAPLHFPSGDPKEQIIVELQAEGITPEDADDDLVRAVYIKGWGQQRRAFQDAVKRDGKPGVGDRFTATFSGEKPSQQGGNPAKLYEYRIQRMQAEADAGWASSAEVGDARAQAEKLLSMGSFTVEQVSAATGLSVDEVRGLADVTPF